MPEISRFLGITIYIYFNDHNPPHFHAKYEGYRGVFDMNSLGLIDGYMPPKVQSLITEWAGLHKNELIENWNSIQKSGIFKKIEPLV